MYREPSKKGSPEDQIIQENKKINDMRSSLQARKLELELQIKASQEAIISLPKLECFVELIRQRLTTLGFETKRQVLDMLGIKVWMDGENIEITGTIPVEDSDVVISSMNFKKRGPQRYIIMLSGNI